MSTTGRSRCYSTPGVCFSLLTLLLSRSASASALELFGFGGRSPALAATGVASSDGFDSVYLNPAGLVAAPAKRLSVGLLAGTLDLHGVDRPLDPALGVQVGVTLPVAFGGPLRDRVVLGLGFHVPTATVTRARAPAPGEASFILLENRTQVVGVQVAAGVRVTAQITAGAGVLALAALVGRIDIVADPAGRFTTASEEQLVTDLAPIAGARWRPRRDLEAGLVFRGVSAARYDIRVASELGDRIPIALPDLRFAGVAQYDPMTLAAEVAWRPGGDWLLGLQAAWEHWSAFPLPTENPIETMPPQDPPGFHDTVVPRAGVEWRRVLGWRTELALRGGYAFVPSPAPEATGEQAFLDNHRHVVSLGVGGTRRGALPLHLDLWAQLHALVPRTNDRPGDTPDVRTSGVILVGGAVLGVDL